MQVTCAFSNTQILPGNSVVAADGFTYDRKTILTYVRKHEKSPITKEPLSIVDLVFESEYIESHDNKAEKRLDKIRGELEETLEILKQEPNFESFPSDISVFLKNNGETWTCQVESKDQTLELSERLIKTIQYNTSCMYFYIAGDNKNNIFTTKNNGNGNLKVTGSKKAMSKISNQDRILVTKFSSISREFAVKKWLDSICVEDISTPALRIILGLDQNQPIAVNDLDYDLSHLNEQQQMVFSSQYMRQLQVIEGPPGTGKTQVVRKMLDFISNKLVCHEKKHYTIVISEKNRGVDAVAERLSPEQFNSVVSFGSDNMGEATTPYLLENKLQYHPIIQEANTKIHDITLECDQKIRKIKRLMFNSLSKQQAQRLHWNDITNIIQTVHNSGMKPGSKLRKVYELIDDIQSLKKSILSIQNDSALYLDQAKQKYTEDCSIILVTFGSLHQVSQFINHSLNNDRNISVTFIVDESSTLLPWQGFYIEHFLNEIGASLTNLCLIGDTKQLPPYFPDHENPNQERSSFLDIAKVYCPHLSLKIQYRVPKPIMQIMNKLYYKESPLLLGHDRSCPKPIAWIHNDGADDELNQTEAKQILNIIIKYVPMHMKTMIISPYKKQCELLTHLCHHSGLCNVVVISVDSAQGNECDVVMVSLVKKAPTSFLTAKRTNVMISRVREKIIVFGNRQECLNSKNDAIRILARNNGVKNLDNLFE